MIHATGNNFGASLISFIDYQANNHVILNGSFTVDKTNASYQEASVLEIYVPDLTISKSVVVPIYMTGEYTDLNGYTFTRGTIVKSWISNRNTICIEKLDDFNIGPVLTYHVLQAYCRLGVREAMSMTGNVRLRLTDPSAHLSIAIHDTYSRAVITDDWVYCSFKINTVSTSQDGASASFRIEGLPSDISLDVPIIFVPGDGYGMMVKVFHVDGDLFTAENFLPEGFITQSWDHLCYFYAIRNHN